MLSNDADEGSYTFGISGFSGLATSTAQSLVLTAPPTAYLGQGTVNLGVWSTSGLPVTLAVTGPGYAEWPNLDFDRHWRGEGDGHSGGQRDFQCR